jgi:hypothetical protein
MQPAGRPTTATAPWRGCLCRDPFDLDADDGPAHDRAGPGVPWPRWRCWLGSSPLQALTVTVPSWSSWQLRWRSGRPGGRSAQLHLAPWRRGRPVLPGGGAGVGVAAAAPAQPHQHRHRDLGQVHAELGRVVAAVEHQPWHRTASGQAAKQRPDLASGLLVGVGQRVQPGRVDRGGPRIAVDAELGDPRPGQPAMIGWPAEGWEGW